MRYLGKYALLTASMALVSSQNGGAQAEEFSYRDLSPTLAGSQEPLIPRAAADQSRRLPALASSAQFSAPQSQGDLIPLGQQQGSQAARIYQRHNNRLSRISGLFSVFKQRAQEEEAQRQAALQRREALAAEQALRKQQQQLEVQQQLQRTQREQATQAQLAAAKRRQQENERLRKEQLAQAKIEGVAPARGEPLRALPTRGVPARVNPPQMASAAPTTRRSIPAGGTEHIVKAGDSLIKIARLHYDNDDSWVQIANANGLQRSSTLRIGDRLVVPPHRPTGSWQDKKKAQAPSEPRLDYSKYEFKLYNVQPGDTLSGISAKFYGNGTKHKLIEEHNRAVLEKGLRSGAKLTIPVPRSAAHDDRYNQLMKNGTF